MRQPESKLSAGRSPFNLKTVSKSKHSMSLTMSNVISASVDNKSPLHNIVFEYDTFADAAAKNQSNSKYINIGHRGETPKIGTDFFEKSPNTITTDSYCQDISPEPKFNLQTVECLPPFWLP